MAECLRNLHDAIADLLIDWINKDSRFLFFWGLIVSQQIRVGAGLLVK